MSRKLCQQDPLVLHKSPFFLLHKPYINHYQKAEKRANSRNSSEIRDDSGSLQESQHIPVRHGNSDCASCSHGNASALASDGLCPPRVRNSRQPPALVSAQPCCQRYDIGAVEDPYVNCSGAWEPQDGHHACASPTSAPDAQNPKSSWTETSGEKGHCTNRCDSIQKHGQPKQIFQSYLQHSLEVQRKVLLNLGNSPLISVRSQPK